MKTLRLLSLLLTGALAALAQPDANSVTVTASRTLSIPPPDQIAFRITVGGPLTSTLEDAAGQLQSLGVTPASFSSLTAGPAGSTLPLTIRVGAPAAFPPPVDSLFWTFVLGVPFAKANATITALTALQPALAQKSPLGSSPFRRLERSPPPPRNHPARWLTSLPMPGRRPRIWRTRLK